MTKTILITNLKEVKGIKIVCRKCGAYWFVPLEGGNPPEQCHNCNNEVPAKSIWKVAQALGALIAVSGEFEFDAFVETELTDGAGDTV